MLSVRPAICLATLLLVGASTGFSQSSPKATGPTPEDDIRATRQMMEEQSLKLEALTQQVAKITKMLSDVQAAAPVARPAEESSQPAAVIPEAPQASPAMTGSNPVHIVAKGETLTSIARHSKISVADLLKLNKIENDRALQIGQTLVLPAPKAQETPAPTPPQ